MLLFTAKNMEVASATFVEVAEHTLVHIDHAQEKHWDYLRTSLCVKAKLLAMIYLMLCGGANLKHRKRGKTFMRGWLIRWALRLRNVISDISIYTNFAKHIDF